MTPVKKQSVDFQSAFDELQKITEWFERGEVDLEVALKKFERGLTLVKLLKEQLKGVEHKVIDIKKQFKDVLKDDDVAENEEKGDGALPF